MKKMLLMVMVAMTAICTVSCNPAQKKIDQLEKLVVKVEKNAESLDKEQWTEALNTYKQITNDMKQYNYTEEQMQRIGKLKGRFYAVAAKYHVNGKGGFFNSLVHEGMGVIQGLWGAADEELSGAIEGIKETLKSTDEGDKESDLDLEELNDIF